MYRQLLETSRCLLHLPGLQLMLLVRLSKLLLLLLLLLLPLLLLVGCARHAHMVPALNIRASHACCQQRLERRR
jgi:hypothetical protein